MEHDIAVGNQVIKIKGKADRIDAVGKVTRIVDYKTGLVDNKELKLEDWDVIRSDSSLAKSFQLLTYAWLYQKMNPEIKENLVSGIITFRELSAGLKPVKVNESSTLDVNVLNEFEKQLHQLVSEIMDMKVDFSQTTELDNCEYCAFKGICNR